MVKKWISFLSIISYFHVWLDAGGGNASDLSCSGQKGTPGAEQLKNLTTIIKYAIFKKKDLLLVFEKNFRECKDNIVKECDPSNIPQPNKTKLESCKKMG